MGVRQPGLARGRVEEGTLQLGLGGGAQLSFLLPPCIPRRGSAVAAEPVQAWPDGKEGGKGDCLSRPGS